MSEPKRILWVDEVSPIDRDRLIDRLMRERPEVLVLGPSVDPYLLVVEPSPPEVMARPATLFPKPKRTHKRNARRSKR